MLFDNNGVNYIVIGNYNWNIGPSTVLCSRKLVTGLQSERKINLHN